MDRSAARPFSDWPDRELVVAFKSGDADAYDEMYHRYGARVAGVCRRMLHNTEDAHEAAQETFLKAYQGLPRFNGNYQLGAWLVRIASNVCVDQLRLRTRRTDIAALPNQDGPLEREPGPEEVVGAGDRAFSTLSEIQPLYARALAMRGIEGMSHKEIAAQLSMTPMQVKALLHRARDSFKRAWEAASGWALAPLAMLRSNLLGSERNASAAGHMGVLSGVGTPLLAEKVAASAIVVAAAIAGVTGGHMTFGRPETAAPNISANAVDEDLHAVKLAEAQERSVGQARVTDLVALLEEVKKKVPEPPPPPEDDGDDDPGENNDPGPGDVDRASREVVRTIKRTVEDLNPLP